MVDDVVSLLRYALFFFSFCYKDNLTYAGNCFILYLIFEQFLRSFLAAVPLN